MIRVLIFLLTISLNAVSQTSPIYTYYEIRSNWERTDWKNETKLRNFIDSRKDLKPIEGIYRYSNPTTTSQYKFLIVYDKDSYKYNAHIISAYCIGCENWDAGDVKAELIEGAIPTILDVTWAYPRDKRGKRPQSHQLIFTSEYDGALIEGGDISLIKLYPKLNDNTKKIKTKSVEWAGNGSGIIISKEGYIITNYHVIEDADEIEVEFILNEEIQKFNAEIVKSDKINDLAIIKIFDMKFDGLDKIPYNFKTRTADVGTKVYAFGYPKALTGMGKEIKVTEGIISSKTGIMGDITTYQITAPIQAGNSGGALFDDKGNLIGINSSRFNSDETENVNYSIKSSYIVNLIDVMPKSIELPSSSELESLPLTEQIKILSDYVVLIKVK